MIDSLHVSASIFHNYQKFRNIQYVLKIDNKQFQDIKLQKNHKVYVYVEPLFVLIISYVTHGCQYGSPRFIPEIARTRVSQTFLLAGPFCLRKITRDLHILADVNIECPDDIYPKLNVY